MGVGRRQFLKLSGLALAGLSIDPLQAVVTNNDYYVNKKLGIILRKPSAWMFVKVKDFGKLRDKQVLGNGWDEKSEEAWEILGEQICVITKYDPDNPMYKGILSPTITLDIEPESELGDIQLEDYGKFLNRQSELGLSFLKDARVIKSYDPYLLNGNRFYEHDYEYLLEHTELSKPLEMQAKVILTRHSGLFYEFHFHQSLEAGQPAEFEFNQFKKDIKLI
ncbi:hypothetical protein WIW50_04855 [Flavobacteriaceae bacterium 3-367]